MKKILLYILVTLLISVFSFQTISLAEYLTNDNTTITEEKGFIATVKPTIIPKPDLLPGPSEEDQVIKEGEEEGTTTGGTRNILISKISLLS